MIGLPNSTKVDRFIPKKVFYENIDISTSLKRAFIDNISKITLANTLSADTLKCGKGKKVDEIEVFYLELKQDDVNQDVLTCIDKHIQYHSLFIVDSNRQLKLIAAYKERSKTNKSAFIINNYYSKIVESDFVLPINGLNMDTIYENKIRFVADDKLLDCKDGESIKQSYSMQAEIDKIEAEIDKLNVRMIKEKQFNKQIEFKDKIKNLQKQLD